MIKKKICMLGAFAVGKTSLVQRFVNSIFSEKYHTTIGVKIDQKIVKVGGREVNLILWDIHGEDEFQKIKSSYLIGASAYFLVVDGTRQNTLGIAKELQKLAGESTEDAPFILLINKSDLKAHWEIKEEDIIGLNNMGWRSIETSAKEDIAVDQAFQMIAELTLKP